MRRSIQTNLTFLAAAFGVAGAVSHGRGATEPLPTTRKLSTLKPYIAIAWSRSTERQSHVIPMLWCTSSDFGGPVAGRLKQMPAGERVLFLWHCTDLIWGDPADVIPGTKFQSPWLIHGAARRKAWADRFFQALKQNGGDIDLFVNDFEASLSMWIATRPQIDAIAADPRFAPVAGQFGLTDVSHVNDAKFWGICRTWNAALQSLINAYVRMSTLEPLHQYFPNAKLCDFGEELATVRYSTWTRDSNGWPNIAINPLRGDMQTPGFYGDFGQISIAGHNDGTDPDFHASPLPTLCWEITHLRGLKHSSDVPTMPWVSTRHFDSAVKNSPYYAELVRHILLNSEQSNLLYFNPEPAVDRVADDAELQAILTDAELTLRHEPKFQLITTDRVPYNTPTVVTGVKLSDGTRIFRVTLSPNQPSVSLTLPGETTSTRVAPAPGDVGAWVVRKPS